MENEPGNVQQERRREIKRMSISQTDVTATEADGSPRGMLFLNT